MSAHTVYDAVLGAYTLKQCRTANFSPNSQVIAGRSSGLIDPSELYGGPAEPQATFDTGDIAGLLGAVSPTAGLAVSSGTITIPFRKRAQQGTYASGTSHAALSATDGLIVPVSINASQDDEEVVASVAVYFRSTTGLANPVSVSTGNALASQSYGAMYTLGPLSINGSQVTEILSWSANFGIQVETRRYDGGIYPQDIFIVQRNPFVDLNFRDLDDLASFTSSYAAMTAFAGFLRKRTDAGTFVSDVTAEHVKVTFGAGIVETQTVEASEGGDGSVSLRLYGKSMSASATNAISF